MQHFGDVKYKNRNREDVSPNAERDRMGTPVTLFLPPDDATKILGLFEVCPKRAVETASIEKKSILL